MQITYEGADITEEITLDRCVYEACEIGRVPWLSIELDDDAGVWDKWAPQPGERVEVVEDGIASTGAMFVEQVEPSSGGFAIRASALPKGDVRAVREWSDTTLFTVVGQLAGVLGLAFDVHGCADMALARVRQDDVFAMATVYKLAAFAGCIVDIHDAALHLCGREWVEAQDSAGTVTLGDDADYSYARPRLYVSCMIDQANADGTGLSEIYGAGEPRLAIALGGDVAFPGSSELQRACAGAMAHENARISGGYMRGSALSPFSPGSVCDVVCDKSPSLTGRGVISRVRNNYVDVESKTWWRAL